jgi:hypothetical protein
MTCFAIGHDRNLDNAFPTSPVKFKSMLWIVLERFSHAMPNQDPVEGSWTPPTNHCVFRLMYYLSAYGSGLQIICNVIICIYFTTAEKLLSYK